jgi:hypothetical protein
MNKESFFLTFVRFNLAWKCATSRKLASNPNPFHQQQKSLNCHRLGIEASIGNNIHWSSKVISGKLSSEMMSSSDRWEGYVITFMFDSNWDSSVVSGLRIRIYRHWYIWQDQYRLIDQTWIVRFVSLWINYCRILVNKMSSRDQSETSIWADIPVFQSAEMHECIWSYSNVYQTTSSQAHILCSMTTFKNSFWQNIFW